MQALVLHRFHFDLWNAQDRRKVCNYNSDKSYFILAKDFELWYLVPFRGGIPLPFS